MNSDIEILIQKISRLPGLGPRSARRIVINLIQNKERVLEPLLICMQKVCDTINVCSICGNIDVVQDNVCSICRDSNRRKDVICIVENIANLWALERTSCFSGQYHVLQGLLSSIEGIGPEALLLDKLAARCNHDSVQEIVIALSATIEGQMTDNYIRHFFKDSKIKITSLARGIPVGGELDYLDDGTLSMAFNDRG